MSKQLGKYLKIRVSKDSEPWRRRRMKDANIKGRRKIRMGENKE